MQLTELELIKLLAGSSLLGGIIAAIITGLVNVSLSSRNFKFKSYEEIVKNGLVHMKK